MILFQGMKSGAVKKDIKMFNFTDKLVPFGDGYDDEIDEPAPIGGGTRKKRKIFDNLKERSARRSDDLTVLTSTFKHTISSFSPSTNAQRIHRKKRI